jgi:serine/threonine protein kinase
MLYELLTLESPFPGSTPEQVEQSIRTGQRVPVRTRSPRVPEKLAQVVERALSPSTSQRFTTAAQFARVLAPLYDDRVATPLAVAAMVRALG